MVADNREERSRSVKMNGDYALDKVHNRQMNDERNRDHRGRKPRAPDPRRLWAEPGDDRGGDRFPGRNDGPWRCIPCRRLSPRSISPKLTPRSASVTEEDCERKKAGGTEPNRRLVQSEQNRAKPDQRARDRNDPRPAQRGPHLDGLGGSAYQRSRPSDHRAHRVQRADRKRYAAGEKVPSKRCHFSGAIECTCLLASVKATGG